MIEIILFDFDGTIADTYGAFVEIVNNLSEEFGYKPVTDEELDRFKRLTSRQIVKESEISLIQIPFILKRVKDELSKKIGNLKIFPGLKSCLYQLNKEGYRLGIVTSNDKNNVLTFLKNNQLDSIFEFIYGGTTLFGKHKIINKIIKENNLNRDQVAYVGDETRDISAAQKSNIKMIAVGWGFNAPEALEKHNPDVLVYHPQELLEALADDKSYVTL